jgi:hypothetical protein
MNMSKQWKKGRGKLGIFEPLIGRWKAEAQTPMGPIKCTRTFSKLHGDKWIILEANWEFSGSKHYIEHAVYGVDSDGRIAFWSFTSDGKHSHGYHTEAADIHAEAIAFEAQMPAGLARMTYWPGNDGSMNWAVESKTKKGWNRFTHHLYSRS